MEYIYNFTLSARPTAERGGWSRVRLSCVTPLAVSTTYNEERRECEKESTFGITRNRPDITVGGVILTALRPARLPLLLVLGAMANQAMQCNTQED